MSFEPEKRPSFSEILEYLFSHNFALADEVDVEDILRRYRSLNRFKNIYEQTKNSNSK